MPIEHSSRIKVTVIQEFRSSEVITSFTEEPDMRSKPVFESTTEVCQHPIFPDVVT